MEKERIAAVLSFGVFETQRVSHYSQDRCSNIDSSTCSMISGIQISTDRFLHFGSYS